MTETPGKPDIMTFPESETRQKLLYQVRALRQETGDTATIDFVRADGMPVPAFTPGQYNMLHLEGEGNAAMAICVDPAEPDILMHTVRAVGRVTRALTSLKVGAEVTITGPYGCGWPLQPAEESDVVVIAGGIGLAPVRSLLYSLLEHRERYGRTILIYGTRTPDDILYRKELERWRGRFDMEVLVTVDRGSRNWRGHVGVFTHLIPRAPFDPYYTVTYISGPEVMMTYAIEAFQHRGVRKESQYLYIQRDLKRGVSTENAPSVDASHLTGPVFRFDEVEGALLQRE